MKFLLALYLPLAAAACNHAPSCEAVADHVRELQAKGGSTLEVVDRAVLVKNCEAESPGNEEFRSCVLKAKTLEDAKGCELAAAFGK
jgi:hypothetical protein